jgi:hypothetical protein
MSSSSTFSLPEEHGLHSGVTGTRNSSNSVGSILDALQHFRGSSGALAPAKPSPAREVARLTYYPPTRAFFFGKFVVESTDLSTGWRVTTTDPTTGVQHNFYVHDGQIHHIDFHAPAPWNHSTPFVVRKRVKRITDSEVRAIRRAIG